MCGEAGDGSKAREGRGAQQGGTATFPSPPGLDSRSREVKTMATGRRRRCQTPPCNLVLATAQEDASLDSEGRDPSIFVLVHTHFTPFHSLA